MPPILEKDTRAYRYMGREYYPARERSRTGPPQSNALRLLVPANLFGFASRISSIQLYPPQTAVPTGTFVTSSCAANPTQTSAQTSFPLSSPESPPPRHSS